ncbi:MAG TPA: hypothetical protein EYP14_14375, partial [Planctomycetaceae bacterium]|nr:hypothetical protein [Planctomycetaceae bacterium]
MDRTIQPATGRRGQPQGALSMGVEQPDAVMDRVESLRRMSPEAPEGPHRRDGGVRGKPVPPRRFIPAVLGALTGAVLLAAFAVPEGRVAGLERNGPPESEGRETPSARSQPREAPSIRDEAGSDLAAGRIIVPPRRTSWRSFRNGNRQLGIAHCPLPEQLDLLWKVPAPDGVLSAAAIVGDDVYVGTLGGELLCLLLAHP